MRRWLATLAMLTCVVPVALTAQNRLTLLLTVGRADGTALSELTPDDVRIIEDGADSKILEIEPVEVQPLTLLLLIDNGAGMGSHHGILRDAVRGFVEAVPEGVEVTMMTTSPRPRVRVPATVDRQALLEGVEGLARDTGAGQFTESLVEAAEMLAGETSRAPVIVSVATPTGADDMRDDALARMAQRLRDSQATVYIVMYAEVQSQVRGERQMQLGEIVAQETRGRFELLQGINGLAPLLIEVAKQATATAAVAGSGAGAGRQFRVTFQRPDGRDGDLGRMQLATPRGLTILSTEFE